MINFIHLLKFLEIKEGGILQKAISTFYGKRQDVTVVNPYGLSSSPPKDSLGLAFDVNGNGDLMAIIDRPDLRFTSLTEGELKIGNTFLGKTTPANKTWIHFKSDGTIEIKSNSTINIIGDVVVTGTVTASNFITASVADYNAHTHSGVQTGAGNTGGPS